MMLIETLEKHSGLSKTALNWTASTASNRYKLYSIPKKSGGRRNIAHPSRDLKAIQRWLNSAVFQRFPIHNSATAYSKGSSIRNNAERHKDSNFTVRLDFKNFFPSFEKKHVTAFLHHSNSPFELDLSDDDIKFVGSIVTRRGRLTIGAPSSPILTNCMMFSFDEKLEQFAREHGLLFSRYADDIFVSAMAPNSLGEVERCVLDLCRSYPYANLQLNNDKTTFLSRKYKRSITGLVVTPNHTISIGRPRKREIKSLIFEFRKGTLDRDRVPYLRGLLGFAFDAEPRLRMSLSQKYGTSTIDELVRGEKSIEVEE